MANDFFENLGKTLSETAKSMGEKTDEFIAVQKLRSQQSSLESEVKNSYKTIGEMVFQKFVNGEAYSEEIADVCREIMQLQSEIAECKERIAGKKGQTICPACGSNAPRGAEFCMKCGSPIPKPEETEDAHYEEAEEVAEETAEEAAETAETEAEATEEDTAKDTEQEVVEDEEVKETE